ncbi:MAG: hypothetical protein Q7J29_02275 [Stagnimonas sp.]|nr:hypothetical protein [Stagnimonas sp.]
MAFRIPHALALLLMAAATFVARAEGSFYGYAYDLDSGKYLYTEVHQPVVEGGKEVASTIRYYTPDGKEVGKKTLDYRADAYVPKFRFDLPDEGYAEAITANGETIDMLKISGKGKEKRKSLKREGFTAADSGFNHAVQDNLPKLVKGEVVSFRFAVAGQLDSYRFKISKVGTGTFEGKPAVKLLVQADSLLRFVAPDLNLLYDPESRRLLEYKGVSNIHDPATGKAYNARIVYFAKPPEDTPKNLPPLP